MKPEVKSELWEKFAHWHFVWCGKSVSGNNAQELEVFSIWAGGYETRAAEDPCNCREIPSLEAWRTRCDMAGIPPWYSEEHYYRQEAANPPWGKVGNWLAYVRVVKSYWARDGCPSQPATGSTAGQPASIREQIEKAAAKLDQV